MSLVSSMNIAQQALTVNQAAITVVSNNISNVDTEGYSKLRVNTAGVVNYTPSGGNAISVAESSSGVTIESVQRYSDTYLQGYYRQENSTNSYLSEYSNVASNIQDLTNELNGTGLSSAFSDFYLAANTLSSNPNDISARENYIQSANNVATVFNTTAGDLNNLSKSLVGDPNVAGSLESSKISNSKDDVNNLLDEIAKVNYDIIKTGSASTSSSSSLLDKRDGLINKLSSLIPVTVDENPNGTVNVSMGDNGLVQGATVKGYLGVASTGDVNNPVVVNIVDSAGTILVPNVNSKITSGSIGAILDVCGSSSSKLTINSVLNSLNTLASNFSQVLNDIQTGDPNGDGTRAMAIDKVTKKLVATTAADVIYQPNDGTAVITAANISVNQAILNDPYKIAAARVTPPTAAQVDNVGNNSNVALVLNSRSQTIAGLGDSTVEAYLSSTVAEVGTGVESVDNSLKDQTLVLNQIQTNLKSKTGVNLDEELVDLVKYQRAYQAAARVFSVCNDLLGELVNLGK